MNLGSQKRQLCIDDFESSLEGLNKFKRWAQLGNALPWDDIENCTTNAFFGREKGIVGGQQLTAFIDPSFILMVCVIMILCNFTIGITSLF